MSRGVIEKLLSGAGAHTWAPSGPRVIIEERAESDQANMELFQTSLETEQSMKMRSSLHPFCIPLRRRQDSAEAETASRSTTASYLPGRQLQKSLQMFHLVPGSPQGSLFFQCRGHGCGGRRAHLVVLTHATVAHTSFHHFISTIYDHVFNCSNPKRWVSKFSHPPLRSNAIQHTAQSEP